MAIVFSEKRKKQQYFIMVFVVVVILTAIVVWFGILKKPNPQSALPTLPVKKVEIDFSIFGKEIFSNLELFKEISPLEQGFGRENPFLPKPAP
jgi:hypothetical protein